MVVREHRCLRGRPRRHADVDAGRVQRMAAGDVDLALRRVRDVEAERGLALELDSCERARAGGGAERLVDDGFELVWFHLARGRLEAQGRGGADGDARGKEEDA